MTKFKRFRVIEFTKLWVALHGQQSAIEIASAWNKRYPRACVTAYTIAQFTRTDGELIRDVERASGASGGSRLLTTLDMSDENRAKYRELAGKVLNGRSFMPGGTRNWKEYAKVEA